MITILNENDYQSQECRTNKLTRYFAKICEKLGFPITNFAK